jgi:hypothetical protein
MNIYRKVSIYTNLIVILLALSLSACSAVRAAAPVDGDVVGLLAGTTNWMIGQMSKYVLPVGAEALYNVQKGLLVIGMPFHEGYGFTILDKNTFTALEDVNVANSLCGNYVNCATWEQFRNWLLANGWVTQVLVFPASVTATWYTWMAGVVYMPDSLEFPVFSLPGLQDGYIEYKQ